MFKRIFVKIRGFSVRVLEVGKSSRDANVIVEFNSCGCGMLHYLFEHKLMKTTRDFKAIFFHGIAELLQIDFAVAIRVNHEKILKLLVQVNKQLVKLFERNFTVAVFVIFRDEQVYCLLAKVGHWLAFFQSHSQLFFRYRIVVVYVDFIKDPAKKWTQIPTRVLKLNKFLRI